VIGVIGLRKLALFPPSKFWMGSPAFDADARSHDLQSPMRGCVQSPGGVLGLGSYLSPMTFHRVEIDEISGAGTLARP